ncbi:MAG: PPOX class F420-dependent oxidoreductase [Anaerolineales bacterium]
MEEMTPEETRAFLLESTRTGKLATVREDGRPHVVPVWFLLDDDDIIFTTGAETVKGRNLQRFPRVALSVDEETPPYAFVLIEGEASWSTNPDERLHWATRIAARYMGEERAEAYGRRNSVAGELLVRITPSKIVAHKGVANW